MTDDRFLPPTDEERRRAARYEDEHRAAGKAAVALDFRTTWCPEHLAPYRERWPHGAATAMVKLVEAFFADPRVGELAGGDALKLGAVVAEHSPLCCYLNPSTLDRIYAETGVKRAG